MDKSKINYKNFDFNGEKIYFPFEPYQIQKDSIKKIISTLNNNKKKKNLAYESATGTCKTQTLLTAVLYKIKKENEIIKKENEKIRIENRNLFIKEEKKERKLLYFTI